MFISLFHLFLVCSMNVVSGCKLHFQSLSSSGDNNSIVSHVMSFTKKNIFGTVMFSEESL